MKERSGHRTKMEEEQVREALLTGMSTVTSLFDDMTYLTLFFSGLLALHLEVLTIHCFTDMVLLLLLLSIYYHN